MNTKQEFENLIDATLTELGGELAEAKDAIAEYAAERSAALATILESGEPGFDQALIAARNSVALKAGLQAGAVGQAVSGIWAGVFAGALRFAAVALAGTPAGTVAAGASAVVEGAAPTGTDGTDTDPEQ